jgi:F0F1-type ATP synthase membrane subunit c/vacuolar-type H+-ATPase subunit K
MPRADLRPTREAFRDGRSINFRQIAIAYALVLAIAALAGCYAGYLFTSGINAAAELRASEADQIAQGFRP